MEFRWLIICDISGVKSKPTLQFKEDTGNPYWETVPIVEIKTYELTKYDDC